MQIEREVRMWNELSEIYMTEESEDETTGVIRQHHIPWQSESNFKSCDRICEKENLLT